MALPTRTPSARERPLPYHSSGHVGVPQPDSPRRSHHSPTVRSGSQFSSSQAVTWVVTSLPVRSAVSVTCPLSYGVSVLLVEYPLDRAVKSMRSGAAVETLSATRQAAAIRAGEISSLELLGLYLERIDRLNPQVN